MQDSSVYGVAEKIAHVCIAFVAYRMSLRRIMVAFSAAVRIPLHADQDNQFEFLDQQCYFFPRVFCLALVFLKQTRMVCNRVHNSS